MRATLAVTGSDLIRALSDAALPGVDRAVRERAEAVARELADDGVVTRVLRRGAGKYTVTVSGENVFAREFGSIQTEAEPFIGATIARARGR